MYTTATYSVRYGNAYEKVIKTIESCKTFMQLMVTKMWIAGIQDKFSENDVYIFIMKIHIQEKLLRNSNG